MRVLLITTLVLLSGCSAPFVGVDAPESTTSHTNSPSSSPTETPPPSTDSSSSPPITSLPPTSQNCLTEAVPRPNQTGEFSRQQYPDPPKNISQESIETFVIEFERAYVHNNILSVENASDLSDFGINLEKSMVFVPIDDRGYIVKLKTWKVITYNGGTVTENFDRDVGYILTDTQVTRYKLKDFDDSIGRSGEGQVVVQC